MSNAMAKLKAMASKSKTVEREEEYFYYPERDSAGNGSAVIRFLPPLDEETGECNVRLYSHNFFVKHGDNKRWLIDECPTTLERDCPICAANKELYSNLTKEEARKYGMNRKTSYVSRILVIEDEKNPDNVGKVFMFKYGKTIWDKLASAMNPQFKEDKPVNVFGLEEGEGDWGDFYLRIRKVDGETKYDMSKFGEETKIKVKWQTQCNDENDPKKFMDEKRFKTFEKLQERLDFVQGKNAKKAPVAVDGGDDDGDDAQAPAPRKTPAPTKRREVVESDDDDDDILGLVNSLNRDDDDDVPQ